MLDSNIGGHIACNCKYMMDHKLMPDFTTFIVSNHFANTAQLL